MQSQPVESGQAGGTGCEGEGGGMMFGSKAARAVGDECVRVRVAACGCACGARERKRESK